ncbi:MAG: undecaprenyl-diphosphatase UppP [Ardenticatenaceae bacterium]|nr:undecaprenyl-diphosphatase UppP [Ardenticatenaceae bacterium]
MTIIEAIILGIIQGATEFLPISSSGHSVLVPAVFGLSQPTLGMSVVAHLGTLLAVVIYFHRDLWQIIRMTLKSLQERQPMAYSESRLAWYIVVGSVPAAAVGLLFEDWLADIFTHPQWAAVFLMGTAVILVIGERLLSGRKQLADMTWLDAIIIGLFQALALLPGISRSGSTIMAGLTRGLNRELAARYSFLMSVPVIFGAGLVQLRDMLSGNLQVGLPILAATFITSAIIGYLCIHFLLTWLRQRNLYPFAIYCAAFSLLFLLFG